MGRPNQGCITMATHAKGYPKEVGGRLIGYSYLIKLSLDQHSIYP